VYKAVGSEEFLTARTEMLNRYRESKSKSSHAPVRTRHGLTAEAVFRKWLATFLPKRFGVTKGSIVAPSVGLSYDLREHDIIIYDRDHACILWEHDADTNSLDDKSRGVSSEEVLAVLEVKATLTKRNVNDALRKLEEVNQFVSEDADTGEPVSKLSPRFHCYVVFFELLAVDQKNSTILDSLANASQIYNYAGGIVLSAEHDSMDCSGRIEWLEYEEPPIYRKAPLFKDLKTLKFRALPEKSGIQIPPQGALTLKVLPFDKPSNLLGRAYPATTPTPIYRWYYEKGYGVHSASVMVADGQHLVASLTWAKSNFARFAFVLKERLEGTYENRKSRSDHGLFFDGTL